MAMKILLMVMLVTALRHGAAKDFARSAKITSTKLKRSTLCKEPQDALVQLPVPEGYDYLEPSVVRLKQCTGLACKFMEKCVPDENSITIITIKPFTLEPSVVRLKQCTGLACRFMEKCVPDENSITNKSFTVVAHNVHSNKCMKVYVEEHGACHCEPVCPPNKVYDTESGGCTCDTKVKDECARRIEHGGQWSQESCSCQCGRKMEVCDSGMTWVEEKCSCVNRDDLRREVPKSWDKNDEIGYWGF